MGFFSNKKDTLNKNLYKISSLSLIFEPQLNNPPNFNQNIQQIQGGLKVILGNNDTQYKIFEK